MPNADTTLIDRAEEAGVSLATYTETRADQHRGVRAVESPAQAVAKRFAGYTPQSFEGFPSAPSPKGNVRLYGALAEKHGARPGWRVTSVEEALAALEHIPGDTTTPPAPGAVWIGSGDA
ncbi:hypothetical protein [Achromobacter dolens]|uniref:hypothetical protein n=1 Tax=Achromobacter dolens TaxID=1287738 RepID=UPI003556B2BA